MHIATPNSTFRPLDDEGDDERDAGGDFFFLSLLRLVLTGVTATAIRDGAEVGAAALIARPPLALTTLPEYGL
jgi:hypothetical protein